MNKMLGNKSESPPGNNVFDATQVFMSTERDKGE